MNAEMTPALEQMLNNAQKTDGDFLDYPPGWSHDYSLDRPVTDGSGLAALEMLELKAKAGLPLNSLEAYAAQLLTYKAEGGHWEVPPPRPKPIRREYTAEVSGTYSTDISAEAFARGLEVQFHSAAHCNPRSSSVKEVSGPPAEAGSLRQVKVRIAVMFELVFGADVPADHQADILEGTRVVLKHHSQPLPALPRSLEKVTLV